MTKIGDKIKDVLHVGGSKEGEEVGTTGTTGTHATVSYMSFSTANAPELQPWRRNKALEQAPRFPKFCLNFFHGVSTFSTLKTRFSHSFSPFYIFIAD